MSAARSRAGAHAAAAVLLAAAVAAAAAALCDVRVAGATKSDHASELPGEQGSGERATAGGARAGSGAIDELERAAVAALHAERARSEDIIRTHTPMVVNRGSGTRAGASAASAANAGRGGEWLSAEWAAPARGQI